MSSGPPNRPYHVPVLLEESVSRLITDPGGTYVDATFGGGGHSKLVLSKLTEGGRLFAFDQDEEAIARGATMQDQRLVLIHSNYRFFENYLKFYKADPVDGVLADIGVSWHQFDAGYRGFSIRNDDELLDMRMSRSQELDARKVLNSYDEKKLADVLYHFGELKNSRQLAQRIVRFRQDRELSTLKDLKDALRDVLKPHTGKSLLVQLFQAIRIEVNDELGALRELLQSAARMIRPEGRLVVISYHSLEDRIVKNFLRSGNFEGEMKKDFFGNTIAPFRPQQAKPVVPDDEEIELNPRSRSARMRVGVKT